MLIIFIKMVPPENRDKKTLISHKHPSVSNIDVVHSIQRTCHGQKTDLI